MPYLEVGVHEAHLSNAFDKSKNITSVALEEFHEVHQSL